MLIIPGQPGKEVCESRNQISRRDLLRVGGSGMMGMGLGSMLQLQEAAANSNEGGGGPGWAKAKSVILIFLQGGPSHIDLWDPKENVPDNVRSVFKPISTKLPGVQFTELLPNLAQNNDKFTMIRSMSYTPKGLFNHTAAIYQMLTGYTTDKVSPSGQLEPPSPKDFPNFGSNVIRLQPPQVSMLPFVMLPRPLQESNVVGKAGTAGFLGRAYDPYYLYPPGDDMDMNKMDKISVDDLKLRPDVYTSRLQRRASLRDTINKGMPQLNKAVEDYKLDKYYSRALDLVISGRARDAFALDQESDAVRDQYGRNTFGQSLLLARRLVEAGTRVVEVVWPKVANSNNHSWDVHTGLTNRLKNQSAPMFDQGLAVVHWMRLWSWRLVNSDAVHNAASVLPGTQTVMTDAITGLTVILPCLQVPGLNGATCMVNRTKPVPAREKIPSIPANCWQRFTIRSGLIRKRLCITI